MAGNVFKLSTMVRENFEICCPQMARNVFKLYSYTNIINKRQEI